MARQAVVGDAGQVQRAPGLERQRLEGVRGHLARQRAADLARARRRVPEELLVEAQVRRHVRPVRQVEHGAHLARPHAPRRERHAPQARLVADGLVQALAQRDGDVLGRVVVVDVPVAAAVDLDLDGGRGRERVEEPVEAVDARRDARQRADRRLELRRRLRRAVPGRLRARRVVGGGVGRVQVDLDVDGRLLRDAPPRARAGRARRRRGRRGAEPVQALPEAAREGLEGRLEDVVRVVAPPARERDGGAHAARDRAPEDGRVARPEGPDELAAAGARGVRAVRLQRHVGADRRADGREQAEAALRVGLVQGAEEAHDVHVGRPRPRAQRHAPQRPAERLAARADDVHGLVGGRAERLVRPGPRPVPDAAAQRDAQLAVRLQLVDHVVEEADARRDLAPRAEVLDRALGRREPRLDGVGPRPRRRGRRRHGERALVGRRRARGLLPPPARVLVRLRVPAPGVLLAARLLVARRPRPPWLPRRQPRRPRVLGGALYRHATDQPMRR